MAPTILFDLDGTLVDTAPDLAATLNWVLARKGIPPVPYEAARKMIGTGARSMIVRGLASEGLELPTAEIDELVRDFIGDYAEHIADRSRPFPGLVSALDALGATGCRLAVCTNKLERLSVKLLEALGLSAHFVAICGADTFGVQKPNPELLHRTIARAGGRLETAVMVGDSISDIAAAHAAGMPVIAVDYGYTEQPVTELGPDRIISQLDQLPAVIDELLAGRRGAAATPSSISPYSRHT
ncbi:MAG: phosphoglycolate phosphatase [Hyphomicrobiales bacterium]|nr:phosphoglycolate phosphatase [Hyphomicrobiales bacterium]